MPESNEKIEEKVEEYFAINLNYDIDSLGNTVQLYTSLKDYCAHMAGENNYYREELSRRFFEIKTELNILGLNLDALHFKIVEQISYVKITMTQDKKPEVNPEKFNAEIKQNQEKIQKDLISLHQKLLQLTKDLQNEAKATSNGLQH